MDSIAYAERIRELCLRYYIPAKKLPNGTDNPKDHPIMRSEAVNAASCMVSIARVFKMLETMEPAFIVSVVIDLSFGLNENEFWKQHNAILVPSFRNALTAHIGAITLRMDNRNVSSVEKDDIINVQLKQWHSLFLVAHNCMYGVAETIMVSPTLSQELAKVL